ncbi:MAG: glutathione S-transferase family protein [Vulcanimicrobiaceae bacterium]
MTARAQFPREAGDDGAFVRQDDAFRDRITAEAGRYHLYVSYASQWAHRTILVRALKGLEDAIGMTVVDPLRDERGWAFRDEPDPVNGFQFLRQAYLATDPSYDARVTVPALWDKQRRCIVNNSDDDIMRAFETEFDALARDPQLDLYPKEHRAEIDALNERLYHTVNDGVYRAGFATTQRAYERAAWKLFEVLDELEERLAKRRFLFGASPLETDWRLFVTLVRFDAVYHGHFKCNLRRIYDYKNLFGYLCDLYQTDGIAATVDFDHIKRHYYYTHDDINPSHIVPIGPAQDLNAAHGRERLT